MLREIGPDAIVREFAALERDRVPPALSPAQLALPHLVMPVHNDVRPEDVIARRLHGALAAAADCAPADFSDLLLVPGIGPGTVRSLAMVAEVVHGAPCRFADTPLAPLVHTRPDEVANGTGRAYLQRIGRRRRVAAQSLSSDHRSLASAAGTSSEMTLPSTPVTSPRSR
jgi:hypothetical protein